MDEKKIRGEIFSNVVTQAGRTRQRTDRMRVCSAKRQDSLIERHTAAAFFVSFPESTPDKREKDTFTRPKKSELLIVAINHRLVSRMTLSISSDALNVDHAYKARTHAEEQQQQEGRRKMDCESESRTTPSNMKTVAFSCLYSISQKKLDRIPR